MVVRYPSIVAGLPEATYRSEDAISQSALRSFHLSPSPYHYYHQSKNFIPTRSMDTGTLLHALVELGTEAFKSRYLATDLRRGTKAFKELIAQYPEKNVIKTADERLAFAMYDALRAHKVAASLFADGVSEESWFDLYNDHKTKGRWDYRNPKLKVLVDLKTTQSASPCPYTGFAKSVNKLHYDWQAAFYLAAAKRLLPDGDQYSFVFVTIEPIYPYAIALYTLAPEDLETATAEVFSCLDRFIEVKESGIWPSYEEEVKTLMLR